MTEPVEIAVQPDAAAWRAAREDAVFLDVSELALLRIEGADAADLLQRVTSQEVIGLEVGSGARACVLSGKGKLLALFELFRLAEDRFVAELPRARVSELAQLLDRYVFAEDVRIEEAQGLRGGGLYGPRAHEHAGDCGEQSVEHDGELQLVSPEAIRWWSAKAPEERRAERWSELAYGGMTEWHALRIERGAPLLGADADEKTLPLEVGLDDACDPDKGCYPGQEIVARIRTYGHVNRVLCKLEIPSISDLPPHGTRIFDEDVEAGRMTSCYRVPESEGARALAMLPRALRELGTELRIGSEAGPLARVTA